MRKNETGPLIHTIYENLLKKINVPVIKATIIKLLEEYSGVNLNDLESGTGFLYMTLNAQATK